MNFRPEEYKKKVSEYVRKYASEEALRQAENDSNAVSSSSESSMSDFSEDEAQVCSKLYYIVSVFSDRQKLFTFEKIETESHM